MTKKHRSACCFTIDSNVLTKDFRRKKRRGGKLDYHWKGPFVIAKNLGKGLFQLNELH